MCTLYFKIPGISADKHATQQEHLNNLTKYKPGEKKILNIHGQ